MWHIMWLWLQVSSSSKKNKNKKQKQKKRNIKSRKIDKKKRKIFKSKHTITLLPIYLPIILLLFFIFLKKDLKILYLVFLFPFYLLQMMIFLFSRKKTLKNQILFFSVVTTSFPLFSNNSDSLSNIANQSFSIFLNLQKNFNPSSLDLGCLEGPVLWSKNTWRYLDFIFDRKLSF